uniref:Progestin and adipoQ receptor family member 4 n=1 Tax=Sus scrofa TaxID=9823 RepID=A0A8D0VWV5_PIG
MAFLAGPRLLDWASSPPHLQFNKFVLTGYRPASSGSGCLRSLFYMHNELGNIYTHGLALLGFLVLLPMTLPWGHLGKDGWLWGTHCVACLAPPAGSVLYHLFMCHKGGSPVYTRLLALDMCGVCLVNTLGLPPPSAGLGKGLGGSIGYRSGYGPPSGLEAGLGGSVKPQRPGFRPGIGLGVRAFPGAAAQPGYGNGLGAATFPQLGAQPGAQPAPPVSPGFGSRNGFGVAFPGAGALPGIAGSVKPPKPGFSNRNGMGAGALPGAGAQQGPSIGDGLGAQPGFGAGGRLQAPGFGTENGAQPGLGGPKAGKPGSATENGYGPDFGADVKPQTPGFGNGLGAQSGSAAENGYGPGFAAGLKPQKPGFGTSNGLGAQPGLGGGLKPQKPVPSPAIQWGPKPPKAGYQPALGYRPGVELGFSGGFKPQKVGFGYRNGALGAGLFLEARPQPGFPGADGFRNGFRGEEALVHPEVAAPAPEGNGQARALRGSPWPSLHSWGAALKARYGAGNALPEVQSQPGRCPLGKC